MKKHNQIIFTSIMCSLLFITVAFITGQASVQETAAAQKIEMRCGWFSNPTPSNISLYDREAASNISLYDREAEWIIGIQGGYQVEGEWAWPVFKKRQWIRTNGDYGYGCVCMQMNVNIKTHEVLSINKVRTRALSVCRKDKTLKRWERMFK